MPMLAVWLASLTPVELLLILCARALQGLGLQGGMRHLDVRTFGQLVLNPLVPESG